jgi:hypothetical protein
LCFAYANSHYLTFARTFAAYLRQRNPNWEAYFIVTDDQPFDDELQAILREYGDARLQFLAIDRKFRGKVRRGGCLH